jgi:FkbM family methyltransferase
MQLSDNYERSVKDLVSKVSRGDAVDVGANFGLFTILLSRRLGEHGIVLSIEPDPFYFKLLTSNIKMNKCHNVLPINSAAWSSNTKLDLIPHKPGGSGFETKVAASSDVSTFGTFAKTVDEFLDEYDLKPKFVKIDVEGAEYQVLSGMAGSLRSDRPIVTFEALTRETLTSCSNFLKDLHYEVIQIDELNHVGRPETATTSSEEHAVLVKG